MQHTLRPRGPSLGLLLLALPIATPALAVITRVEVLAREALPAAAGSNIAYERVRGRYHGELDPADPRNAVITDLQSAPRNPRGKVAYSATFEIARPASAERFSGVLVYDVANRGNGRALADRDGHLRVVSGWQGDIPTEEGLQTATVPVARAPDGGPLTGPVLVRWIDQPRGARSLPLRAGLHKGVPRPPPLDLDSAAATLVRQRADGSPPELLARSNWAFADCSREAFPGVPDATQLCLRDGFDPDYAYELRYTAQQPPVLGIGFAAVRDWVEFLRTAPARGRLASPAALPVRHAIAIGVSQSGNFLRSFVHLGFNEGAAGRPVFDGINPHIAARLLPLNLRFGVPGGAANEYEPGSEGVLWWGAHDDAARGQGAGSLLERCAASRTCPKVVETFGSAEFWGLRMSPDLVGFDAVADIELPPAVRRYYFPGTTHGGGRGGFGPAVPPVATGCLLPANPNPMAEQMRAVHRSLVAWVVEGVEPPASRYPRLDRGDLVMPQAATMGFPRIPGAPLPDGHFNPMPWQDFGPGFNARDLSGVMTWPRPVLRGQWPVLVPRTDADGNETSGVPSVQHRVPLGTYLGWNVQYDGWAQGRVCGFQGGYIPFARTRAEREQRGDPRPSLQERYGTQAGYLERVRAAAAALVVEGFLEAGDAERLVSEAAAAPIL
jgi:Alpha/beta hydrolase domain